MCQRSFAATLALCMSVTGACAQTGAYNSVLDVSTSARSVAMGESFVAVPGEPTALMSNPAGLAALEGIGFSYSQRSFDWMSGLDDYKYHGANIHVAAPFGVFGIEYNRFSMGEYPITSASSPDGIGTVEIYSHSVAVGFGMHLTSQLSAGIAAKYFDIVYSTSVPVYYLTTNITPAYLADAGFQYTVPIPTTDSALVHAFTAGIAVQNIGTDMKFTNATESASVAEEMPRYLRLGAAYQLDLLAQNPQNLRPVSLLFSAEYRRILNEAGGIYAARDFWGFGAECTAMEIVSLRIGAVIMPFTSIYGEKGKLMFRVGLGLHLPLVKIGLPIPLVVSGGYANIPIENRPNNYMQGNTNSLSAFSVGVDYVVP
jgi:hypothetical protein